MVPHRPVEWTPIDHLEQLAAYLTKSVPVMIVADQSYLNRSVRRLESLLSSIPGMRYVPLAVISDDAQEAEQAIAETVCNLHCFQWETAQNDVTAFIERNTRQSIYVKFWGVRGSTPCANSENMHVGGNTSCVQIQIPGMTELLILDSGTGIRNLGNYLDLYAREKLTGNVFITHPHWDHIQGFPFFKPFYSGKNRFTIRMPQQYRGGAEDILAGHLTKTFFPVTLDMLSAELHYQTQKEQPMDFGHYKVDYMVANHPTKTAMYRFQTNGYTIIYAPDNELPLEPSPLRFLERFEDFISGCDLLIHDAQFSKRLYKERVGWGHSAREHVTEIAKANGVKRLLLTHHDVDDNDQTLRKVAKDLQKNYSNGFLQLALAREGSVVQLPLGNE